MPAEAAPVAVSRRAMVLIFLAALAPRMWALNWAMPLKHGHIDESVVVFYSLRVLAEGPNPAVFFDYPAFFLYVLAALFKTLLFFARLLGQDVPSAVGALSAYTAGDGLLFLLGGARALNALLGALVSVVLLRMGAARFGVFAGVAAALLWALNPLAVRHAHYATVDMALVFLFLLAVERLCAFWDEGERQDGLWAAGFIGLAAATKYYPAALGPFLLAASLRRRRWGEAAGLSALSAGVFLAASPYTLLAFSAFRDRFAHLAPKIAGGGGVFLWPTLAQLSMHLGLCAGLAAAGGAVILFKSSSKGDNVLALILVAFLIFLGTWSAQIAHYALPLYPLFFLSTAVLLSSLFRWSRALPAGALAVLLALSVSSAGRTLSLISAPDTRLAALAWTRESLPPASRVLRFAHTPEFTPRDPFQVTVDWENKLLAGGVEAFPAQGFDYLIHGTYDAADPVPAALSARFTLLRTFGTPPPDFPHHPTIRIYKGEKRP